MTTRLVATLFGILVVLASCAPETETTRSTRTGTRTGEEIYAGDCAWCHGSTGTGTERGPDISAKGTASVHFVLSTGRMPVNESDEPMRRGEPAYDSSEIEEVVSYARGIVDGPDVPDVDAAAGDTALGAELYLENCASCHSSSGGGGILTGEREVPPVLESTPTEVAEAMLTGPGHMPVFGVDTFDSSEVNAIARYVEGLQSHAGPGGGELGRLGPVMEGFIGLIVGLGAIVLVVRGIGTRADE